jgi:hypothetical protein
MSSQDNNHNTESESRTLGIISMRNGQRSSEAPHYSAASSELEPPIELFSRKAVQRRLHPTTTRQPAELISYPPVADFFTRYESVFEWCNTQLFQCISTARGSLLMVIQLESEYISPYQHLRLFSYSVPEHGSEFQDLGVTRAVNRPSKMHPMDI